MKNNLQRTIIALGFAALSTSAFAQQRTVKPEEVPLMNPSYLKKVIFFQKDDLEGFMHYLYDANGDGDMDAEYIYEYKIDWSDEDVNMKLLRFIIDHNKNGLVEQNEITGVDYSDKPSEPPQIPKERDNELRKKQFDLKEGEGVGV